MLRVARAVACVAAGFRAEESWKLLLLGNLTSFALRPHPLPAVGLVFFIITVSINNIVIIINNLLYSTCEPLLQACMIELVKVVGRNDVATQSCIVRVSGWLCRNI